LYFVYVFKTNNNIQGAPIKNEPLGKIRYLWNGSKFFRQIYRAYRGGFRPHILQNHRNIWLHTKIIAIWTETAILA